MFQASFGSDLKGPIRVVVHEPSPEAGVSMLQINDARFKAVFTIFRDGPDGIAQFLEIGRAIVSQCESLLGVPANDGSDPFLPSAPNEADQSAVTHDFRPGAYAINDAVQHDEAMEAAAKAGPNPMPF